MNEIEVYPRFSLTLPAQDAILTLALTGRSAYPVWKGEPPPFPVRNDKWELAPVLDESDLPIEVQRRINIIRRQDIPIRDILIAHELPPPKPIKIPELPPAPLVTSPKPRRSPSIRKADNHILWDVFKGLAIGTAVFFGLAVGGLMALFFLPFLLPLALLAAAPFIAVYDPIVVVVLDDGPQTWLSIASWYE